MKDADTNKDSSKDEQYKPASYCKNCGNPLSKNVLKCPVCGKKTTDLRFFWGLLFGLIFFMPILGLAIGAGIGALTGHFTDVGIDDDFIKEARSQITEGTSALFLMVSDVTEDKVADAMKGLDAEVISTNLTKEQDEQLRAAFAEEA